ncbi:hypothetical protein C0J52_22813, partial [Blattella germanica]
KTNFFLYCISLKFALIECQFPVFNILFNLCCFYSAMATHVKLNSQCVHIIHVNSVPFF